MNEWKEYTKKCTTCGKRFIYRRFNLKTKKSYIQNPFFYLGECNDCFNSGGLNITNLDKWREE